MNMVGGLVLAAGSSVRMGGGTPKQLLRFGDRTMVQTVVDTAEASPLDRIVVVTGAHADAVTAGFRTTRATVTHNPDHLAGNATSLRTGLAALGDCDAVVLLLGDMPGVDTTIVRKLVDRWRDRRPWAAVTTYADGGPNHPFLLSAAAVAAVRQTSGPKVLWRLLVTDPPESIDRVRFERPAPVDVDTPQDYIAALRALGHAEIPGDVTSGS